MAEPEPQSSAARSKEWGYSRGESVLVLATLIAASVTLSFVTLPFSQVVDPVRKTFGIDDLQFSLLLGAFAIVPSMLMSIGGGWLVDRVSRRRMLLLAMTAWTAGAIWTALAPTYPQLALARIVIAAAAGVKFPLSMTWINDAFPPQRRGRAVGVFFVVLGIGPAIGASLGGVVLATAESGGFVGYPLLGSLEPWRSALLLLALVNLVVLPFVVGLRDQRPVATVSSADSAQEASWQMPLTLVVLVVIGLSLLSLADNANLAWLPTVLKREHGFGAQQIGFTFALITTFAGISGPLAAGAAGDWMYRRAGTRGRLQLCAAASLVCAPLLAVYLLGDSSWLVTALVVSGAISVGAMSLGFVAFQALLPSTNRGFGTGLANSVATLASALGPTLVAWTAARFPEGPSALAGGIAVVSVLTYLVVAALYAFVAWRTGRRHSPSPATESASALA